MLKYYISRGDNPLYFKFGKNDTTNEYEFYTIAQNENRWGWYKIPLTAVKYFQTQNKYSFLNQMEPMYISERKVEKNTYPFQDSQMGSMSSEDEDDSPNLIICKAQDDSIMLELDLALDFKDQWENAPVVTPREEENSNSTYDQHDQTLQAEVTPTPQQPTTYLQPSPGTATGNPQETGQNEVRPKQKHRVQFNIPTPDAQSNDLGGLRTRGTAQRTPQSKRPIRTGSVVDRVKDFYSWGNQANRSSIRGHFFKVEPLPQMHQKYTGLKGDILKREILKDAAAMLETARNEEHLGRLKEQFEGSLRFKVLATRQPGVFTSCLFFLNWFNTSSVGAWNKLYEAALEEIRQPTPSASVK